MKPINWILPTVVVTLAALYLASGMRSPGNKTSEMQIHKLGKVPVVQGGRIKPLDTLARTSLMIISGRGESYIDADGQKQPAIHWLLTVMSSGERKKDDPARKLKVFRIENDQVLGLLNMSPRSGFRYSIDEIMYGTEDLRPEKPDPDAETNFERLTERIKAARDKEESQHDLIDKKVLELEAKLGLYYQLAERQTPYVIPPAHSSTEWMSLYEAEQQSRAKQSSLVGDARKFNAILKSFAEKNTSAFNAAVDDYAAMMQSSRPEDARVASAETFFNSFAPFYRCVLLYAGVFFLAIVGWLVFPVGASRPLWWSAFWLMALVFTVHTFAIVARIYIQGRPPVTNLYSSAIFIGWAVVLISLVVELLSRLGVATAIGALVGFLTLIVAHFLGLDGDTMEMLRAVLDTNFWLATHVTAVTIGYAATFMAGALGAAYILLGVFTPLLKQDLGTVYETVEAKTLPVKMDVAKLLSTMLYGVVCFALFFSFVGTVLGGIWADQSWGRFWGWDPKENGAVLIVLCNAIILHARWGGMIRQRGMANLAVFGNIVTAWSWFGVNMLGVGLHSYGFIPSALTWLLVFVGSQMVIMGVGLLPERFWISYLVQPQPARRAPGREEALEAIAVG